MATLLPTGIPISKTYEAGASLATYQGRIVKLSAAGKVVLGTAACKCHGVVVDDNAAAGYNASVVTHGETPVEVDATTPIAVGDRIACGANGLGVKLASSANGGLEFLGTAMEAKASGVGTIVVDVDPGIVAVSVYPVDTSVIVVSSAGDDTDGDGSWDNPVATLAKAKTLWTAQRPVIWMVPGAYAEAAFTWPNISGLVLETNGSVISNTDAAAAVITIAPTYTASTFEATIKGRPNLSCTGAQIGLLVANAGMTKKLNVYVPDGLEQQEGDSGDGIYLHGTVSGQAIRFYADGPIKLEGLLNAAMNDAGSRVRLAGGGECMGGITASGAVAAELSLKGVTVLTSGLSVATQWLLTNVGCVYATDADPRVHTQFADAYNA